LFNNLTPSLAICAPSTRRSSSRETEAVACIAFTSLLHCRDRFRRWKQTLLPSSSGRAEHWRLWLRQQISNALGCRRPGTIADCAATIAENSADSATGQDAGLQIVVIVEHDLNRDPKDFLGRPLEFGNGTKGSLPELPVEWIPGEARQTLLMVVECPILPHHMNLIENPAPLLKITKHVIAHRLKVLLCDPLPMEQAPVQSRGVSPCRFACGTRGFSRITNRWLPKRAHRWPFSGSPTGTVAARFSLSS
jgi:hypothetical protein